MENKPDQKKAMKSAIKGLSSFIFYMIADFALLAGLILILFGIGEYITKVIGIAGSGNVILGLVLFIAGVIIISRAKGRIQIGIQPSMQQGMPPAKPPEPPSVGTYR
jgi:MFS superfamily sulfate permease-like transporter